MLREFSFLLWYKVASAGTKQFRITINFHANPPAVSRNRKWLNDDRHYPCESFPERGCGVLKKGGWGIRAIGWWYPMASYRTVSWKLSNWRPLCAIRGCRKCGTTSARTIGGERILFQTLSINWKRRWCYRYVNCDDCENVI
jgi:hypothetical protein